MSNVILRDTYNVLVNKIKELKKEVRENSNQIGEAADFGDLKENGEYKAAKEIQAMLFSKLKRLQPYLAAIIIEKKEISTEVVSFGTTVKLKDLVTQKVVSYTFVGPVEYELEIYPSIVTFTSPLGKALVGKKKGESVNPDEEDEIIYEDEGEKIRHVNIQITGDLEDYKIRLKKVN